MSPWILLLLACGARDLDESATDPDAPTWWRDAGPIVDASCAGCHTPGGIAPLALTSYEEAWASRTAIASAVSTGRMPPWMPAEGCQDYEGDTSLSPDERDTLLAWVDAGAPEGDPADAPPAPEPRPPFEADLVLPLPEAYTPALRPDDYRCQLLDHAFEAPTWVTGLEVLPDRQDMVHHVIAFVIPAGAVPTYEGYDDAEAGPGWTCFGGPTPGSTVDGVDLTTLLDALATGELPEDLTLPRALGAWVPGSAGGALPEGTGVALEPGDRIVLQMHYNTTVAEPGPDRSELALQLQDTVELPAVTVGLLSLGWVTGLDLLGGPMTIPAGAEAASHSAELEVGGAFFDRARDDLGLPAGAPLKVHRVGHHMHTLGSSGFIDVLHADGTDTCLLDLPRWDFSWQGGYVLTDPVTVVDGDVVRVSCTWDNSGGATDVAWGEGTDDEMCLGSLYVTAAE